MPQIIQSAVKWNGPMRTCEVCGRPRADSTAPRIGRLANHTWVSSPYGGEWILRLESENCCMNCTFEKNRLTVKKNNLQGLKISLSILCVMGILTIISGEAGKWVKENVLEIIGISFILLVVLVPVFILRSRKKKAGGYKYLEPDWGSDRPWD
jgi:hypothetical protein